ncbi:MAG: hypothetical protein A4E51_01458 [Methanosaeta sp. PtaU1.Bin055]|nr:MAG: hypothetical protein A4E51_01458 [Methanosaeta sp. PtaU1.Bin055]
MKVPPDALSRIDPALLDIRPQELSLEKVVALTEAISRR